MELQFAILNVREYFLIPSMFDYRMRTEIFLLYFGIIIDNIYILRELTIYI